MNQIESPRQRQAVEIVWPLFGLLPEAIPFILYVRNEYSNKFRELTERGSWTIKKIAKQLSLGISFIIDSQGGFCPDDHLQAIADVGVKNTRAYVLHKASSAAADVAASTGFSFVDPNAEIMFHTEMRVPDSLSSLPDHELLHLDRSELKISRKARRKHLRAMERLARKAHSREARNTLLQEIQLAKESSTERPDLPIWVTADTFAGLLRSVTLMQSEEMPGHLARFLGESEEKIQIQFLDFQAYKPSP